MSEQQRFMQRAIDEASKGLGRTRPNPAVGCVVVKNGEIVATGYHVAAGRDHAEVMALKAAGDHARGADVYVTLEPCSHYGRTPPCADALIDAGVARVFIGTKDPNELVDGRGIRKLREAGIAVKTGILKSSTHKLIEAFCHFIKYRRPWVVAKLAMTLDGRVATRDGVSKWITSAEARNAGHILRNRCDAIAVGVGTVLADDPSLTCRVDGGRDPIRIVFDSHYRTPPNARVVKLVEEGSAETWLIGCQSEAGDRQAQELAARGVKIIGVAEKDGRLSLPAAMDALGQQDIVSLLVEGGPTLHGAFFDHKFVNKVHAFVAPSVMGGKDARSAVEGFGVSTPDESLQLEKLKIDKAGTNLWLSGYCRRSDES